MTEAKLPELKGLEKEPPKPRECEVDNCGEKGIYPAPRNRNELRSYFWFCLQHVREYNKRWDYFDGLNGETELEIRHRWFGPAALDNSELFFKE